MYIHVKYIHKYICAEGMGNSGNVGVFESKGTYIYIHIYIFIYMYMYRAWEIQATWVMPRARAWDLSIPLPFG